METGLELVTVMRVYRLSTIDLFVVCVWIKNYMTILGS